MVESNCKEVLKSRLRSQKNSAQTTYDKPDPSTKPPVQADGKGSGDASSKGHPLPYQSRNAQAVQGRTSEFLPWLSFFIPVRLR